SAGTKSGTVSFTNNDGDENPFSFTITGVVNVAPAPEITVSRGATVFVDGSTEFDFGSTTFGTTQSRTFTVTNDGNATLNLGSVDVPAGYTLTDHLPATLAPDATTTFSIRLEAATVGTKSGQVSFTTNDPDEDPFTFSITGIVNPAP